MTNHRVSAPAFFGKRGITGWMCFPDFFDEDVEVGRRGWHHPCLQRQSFVLRGGRGDGLRGASSRWRHFRLTRLFVRKGLTRERRSQVRTREDHNESTKCGEKFSTDFLTCTKVQGVHRSMNHSKHKRFNVETRKGKITEREMLYFNSKA